LPTAHRFKNITSLNGERQTTLDDPTFPSTILIGLEGEGPLNLPVAAIRSGGSADVGLLCDVRGPLFVFRPLLLAAFCGRGRSK
jgi:hypothetical protein